MNVTLKIDRETREMLWGELESSAPGDGLDLALRHRDRNLAVEIRDAAAFTVDLLDQLGWDEASVAEEYELTIDPRRLHSWIRRDLRELRSVIGDKVVALQRQERGEDDHFYCGMGQEESIDESRRLIAADARRVELLEAMFGQLRAHQMVA